MDGHVGQLDIRYQVGGTGSSTADQIPRLERIAHRKLATVVESALEQAYGRDPAVYILRNVDAKVTLLTGPQVNDEQIAQRWGRRVARAIVQAIKRNPGDGRNLVRFADQAEYVASFVSDLLEGRAWDRWFYRSFARLQTHTISDAVGSVLQDHGDHLPAILRYLHRDHKIEALLEACDETTLQALWSEGLDTHRPPPAETLHPLLNRALALLDRLDLWERPPPPRGPLLEAYLAEGPAPANWQDRDSLTVSFLDILHFLMRQGYVRRREPDGRQLATLDEVLADFDWLDVEVLSSRLTALTAVPARRVHADEESLRPTGAEDEPPAVAHAQAQENQTPDKTTASPADRPAWQAHADDDALQPKTAEDGPPAVAHAQTQKAQTPDPTAASPADLPARPTSRGPTPLQNEILAALGDALPHSGLTGPLNTPANALRWYTALLSQAPRWAGYQLAREMIRRVLQACYWLNSSDDSGRMARCLHRGDVQAALQHLPPTSRQAAAPDIAFLARLGHEGLKIVDAVRRHGSGAPARTEKSATDQISSVATTGSREGRLQATGAGVESASAGVESACAGVALLLRALLDTRLPFLLKQVNYPPGAVPSRLAVLLVALAMRWHGAPAPSGGHVDLGFSLLAGEEEPFSLAALRNAWSAAEREDHERFQGALFRLLVGQRLITESALHIYAINLPAGEQALVAGARQLWPFGRLIAPEDEVKGTVDGWMATCAAAGRQPSRLVCDLRLAEAMEPSSEYEVVGVKGATADGEPSEFAAAHETGRNALLAALETMDGGRLGVPQADLTVGLAAIALLRVWSRWLRGFDRSSVPYLLNHFIRRSGRLYSTAEVLTVEMEPRSLDMVIEMAGYARPLENVSWLGNRDLHFEIRGQ